MDSDLLIPLHIIQDSRYAIHDVWELDDISQCSSGNIAVSGHRLYPHQSYVSIYGSGNSDSRDKPALLHHKQFTDKVPCQSWQSPRSISFIKPNSIELVTCQFDKVQVIDFKRDVLRSRKVNGVTTCLTVNDRQIFIGLDGSDIVNIYDNDLNRIKSITLKGIRGDWPDDIAAAADRLCTCIYWNGYGRAILYSQDSGNILTEYTAGQYRRALSIAVNAQLGLIAVLRDRYDSRQDYITFHVLSGSKLILTVNVESGVSRIRISGNGRIVTGNKNTGEVKIYMLHSFVTYDTLKQFWQALLQKDDCKRLTDHFHLPKDQTKSILMGNTPSNDLLLALEERETIYPSNVNRLIDAFVALQMNEAYYKIANIYQENASATAYERFLVNLSAHLTASMAKDLCGYFEMIPDDKKSNITSNQNPGLSLLLALDKMGIITQSRVLALEKAFANLKLVQAVAKIQEYQSMIEDERDFQHTTGLTKEEKQNLFIKLLQKKIMSWYEAMTPVPWKKSCQWKSSALFVGSRLILTNSKNARKLVNVDEKCKFKYTEIFTHDSLKEETRIIIEGEPGSGKTMLSSQLAYDWSQGKIRDISILILLPLKFVQRKSLLEAIKEFYVIEGKGLSLVDIEDVIIREGVKCCFFLDGLEEYNGKDETLAEEISEVMKVMTKIKYPNCKVILTSRSDYAQDLPSCPMLKLGAFGEAQRQSYIEKVFSDDHEKQMKVKDVIDETSFIQDLCSVPLLFVLALHNIGSIVNVQDVWKDRVSPFIGAMLKTLCPSVQKEDEVRVTQKSDDQCRYMQRDEDSKVFVNDDLDILGYRRDFDDYSDMSDSDSELDVHETYQYRSQGISLEMLAFNGLCRGKQQLSWQKKFVEDNVKNVKKYLDSGILVVEDAANVGMDIARTDKENVDTTQFEAVFSEVNENASGAWNIPTERDSDSSREDITQKESVKEAFQELQKGNVDITFKNFESRYVEEFSDVLENTDQNDNSTNEQLAVHGESEHSEYLKNTLTIQHVSLQVKFLHKVLQEWFAAKYLAGICWKYSKLALPNTYNVFKEHLQQINPADLHYVLRFTCALCPPSCHFILNYLLSTFRSEEGKIPGHIMNCICLCLAEYDGYKGHYIKDVISEVCKADITINSEDSRLIQRTKVSMLQLASDCGFPVSRLQLVDVVVRAAEDELTFTSGATLQTLHTLHEIEMSRWDETLKEEDYTNIVKFISNSTFIKKAVLHFPIQPPVLEPETLKEIAAKQITVSWHIGQIIQTLDPSKGEWMVQLRERYNQVTSVSSVEACQDEVRRENKTQDVAYSVSSGTSNISCKHAVTQKAEKINESDSNTETSVPEKIGKVVPRVEPDSCITPEELLAETTITSVSGGNIGRKSAQQSLNPKDSARGTTQRALQGHRIVNGEEQGQLIVTSNQFMPKAEAVINQLGGVIEIPNTGVILRIPPNALPENIVECLIQMRIIPIAMCGDESTTFSSNSTVRVELLPNHYQFRCEVELILPHCLVLKKNFTYKGKIFMSHHDEGERPDWEEQKGIYYELRETVCTLWLKNFCWIKFDIDDEIVEGKRLKLYTAAKKMYLEDQYVAVHVGYHLDMPGEQEILRMNPKLILEQRHPFLFLREGKNPLLVQLMRIIPKQWNYFGENPQEIPFQSVAASIEYSCTFIAEKETHDSDIPMCLFVASQNQRIGKHEKESKVKLMIRPEVQASPYVQSSSTSSLTDPGNHFHPRKESPDESLKLTILQLSRKLNDEWEFVGRELGLQNEDLYRIKQNTASTNNAIYKMLEYWRQIKNTEVTYSKLIQSLKKARRTDLAEKVQHLKDFFEEA